MTDAESTEKTPGPTRIIALGAAWGTLVAAALAAAETGLLTLRSVGYGWGGPIPPELVAASLGEMFLTQALVLVPAAAVASAVGLVSGRRQPVALSASFAAVLGSAYTIVAHGVFETHLGHLESLALAVVAVLAAIAAHRAARRAPWPRRATAVAAVLGLAGTAALARSPLFDPGAVGSPAAAPASAEGLAAPSRPHVLWVVLDTARADRTSLHDAERETTPFLARWGRDAHIFDRAVGDGIWTSPSHASMFTGLPVRAHGMGRTTVQLSPLFPTVAEKLAKAGYTTASFSNNPLIGSGSGLARGFSTQRIPSRLAALGCPAAEIWIHRFGWRPILPWWSRDQGAATTNHLVAGWLSEHAESGAPLFLFINYMEAHLPWDIPERQRMRFLDDEGAARSRALRHRVFGDLELALNQRVAREGQGFLSEGDREVLRRLYDGTLYYLDARVAELLGSFQAHGLLENTLVIVSSDHGEYLGNHDLWSHLYRSYEDLTHVVLAVRDPAAPGHRRHDGLVQLSDLHHTVLLRTLGAESGADASRDLLTAPPGPRIAISEAGAIGARSGTEGNTFRMPDTPRGRRLAQPELAIRSGRFKLLQPESGAAELYDLRSDPTEQRNILGQHGAVAVELTRELRRFERRVKPYQPSLGDLQPTPELQRALRELGYVAE